MNQSLTGPKACCCCLSTDRRVLRLAKRPALILDFLIGKKLDLAELWMCYRCSHAVKKISLFRDLCSRAYAVLQKYSTIQSSNVARNYFRGEKAKFSKPEPSMSNTLCMSIMLERFESPIHIDSFNRNGKLPKNYTENITRNHEILSEENIKMETEFNCDPFESIANAETYPQIPWSNNIYNVKFEGPSSSPELDDLIGTVDLPIESPFKIEDMLENQEQSSAIFSEPNVSHEPPHPELSSSDGCSRLPKKHHKAYDAEALNLMKSYEKTLKRKKTPKNIAEEVEKLCTVPLTLEEQIKEKEDRAKEESYLSAAYKCELCVITFQSRLGMVNHRKKHEESKGPHVCQICSLRFSKHDYLRIHSKSHSIRFVCHICEKRVYNKVLLKKHLIWHSGNFNCDKCSKVFKEEKLIKEHMKKEHPTKCECEICGKTISSRPNLYQIHMQRHRGVPTHVCSICSKGFYSEQNLYLHLETHKEKKLLKHYCVECDRHFKTLHILNKHLIYAVAHRDLSILKYKCADCPKAFHSVGFLARHADARHGGELKYVCDECGASYATRYTLVKHIKYVHQGFQRPKKFPCTLCEKAFINKCLLDNHIRVHTGERPFKCPQCPDTFTQKSALGTHIKLVHLKLKRNIKSKKKIDGCPFVTDHSKLV